MRGKENEGMISASLGGSGGSSYVARLQKRKELEKLHQSRVKTSITNSLMRKSSSSWQPSQKNMEDWRSRNEGSNNNTLRNSLMPTIPRSPPGSSASGEALIDDATDKLEKELRMYDAKLKLLRSHVGTLPPVPLPPSLPDAQPATTLEMTPSLPAESNSAEKPIVRGVITASGQGCKEVVASSSAVAVVRRAVVLWKTRAHKSAQTESTCTLLLAANRCRDIAIRITFTEASAVPAMLCFEHAPSPTAAFSLLGRVPLQTKSLKQLKHVFRLGPDTYVEKCLRISCLGHVAEQHSNLHSVNFLAVTGLRAPDLPVTRAPAVKSPLSGDIRRNGSNSTGSTALQSRGFGECSTAESQTRRDIAEVELSVSLDSCDSTDSLDSRKKKSKGTQNKLAAKKGSLSNAPLPTTQESSSTKKAPSPEAVKRPVSPLVGDYAHGLRMEEKPRAAMPPPPPPLPGTLAGRGLQRMAAVAGPKPSRPTMKLFWDKLPPRESTINATVWRELKDVKASVDFGQLEEEFAAKPAAVHLGNINKGASLKPAQLLTLQRANIVGAMLAKIKLSPERAVHAVLSVLGEDCDEDENADGNTVRRSMLDVSRSIDEEEIGTLVQCLPTDEERRRLVAYEGPEEALNTAERFMLGILGIPVVRERLQAILFLHEFDERVAGVVKAAECVTAASSQVRASELLRLVLKTALLIGNFLNTGNRNGEAAGFQVDSLLKLKDVRSSRVRTRTLLHFLARELVRRRGEGKAASVSLTVEIPGCRAASRISLADLRGELDMLADGIESATRAGREGEADPDRLDELLELATDRLAEANARVVEADACFMELRTFFHGKHATMEEPNAFFSLLATFCEQLDAAHAENAVADQAHRNNVGNRGATRPTSAPARAPVPASPHTSEEPSDLIASQERRRRLLATIRTYSRSTASERNSKLLVRSSAPEATTTEEEVNVSSGNDVAHANEEGFPKLRASGVIGSVVTMADLLARSGSGHSGGSDADRSLNSTSGAAGVVNVVGTNDGAIKSDEMIRSPDDSLVPVVLSEKSVEELHQPSSQKVPAISSPVARLLASSKALVESVNLRASQVVVEEKKSCSQEEEEVPEATTAAEVEGKACVEEEKSSPSQASPSKGTPSPVTLRVAGALPSPDGTPQVSWSRRPSLSLTGDEARCLRLSESWEANATSTLPFELPQSDVGNEGGLAAKESTPSVVAGVGHEGVVEQKPHGGGFNAGGVWQSAPTALCEEDSPPRFTLYERGQDEDALSDSLSMENPMQSTPVSPIRFDDYSTHRTQGVRQPTHVLDEEKQNNSQATSQQRVFPQVPVVPQQHHGILRTTSGSLEWARASNGKGMKISKRVSFSLPNSPRDSLSGDNNDCNEQHRMHKNHWTVEDHEAFDPLLQVPTHASGLDLELAKKLVKKADDVRRSWSEQDLDSRSPSPPVAQLGGSVGGHTAPVQQAHPMLSPSVSLEGSMATPVQLEQSRATYITHFGSQLELPPALPLEAGADMDRLMAAVIANAGNTPTGPLGRGVRQGDVNLFDDDAAEQLRAKAVAMEKQRTDRHRKALLEPIVPAPLGMGVRVSETLAQGISPLTLKQSLEAHLRAQAISAPHMPVPSSGTREATPLPAREGGASTVGTSGVAGLFNASTVSAGRVVVPEHSMEGGSVDVSGKVTAPASGIRGKNRQNTAYRVNSSLAHERLARWGSLQRRSDSTTE